MRGLEVADETNSTLTPEQMGARIAELEGRLAKGSSLSFQVSENRGVSVYGFGRFPVTLYLEQWNALLSHAAELREFIEANKSKLKTRSDQEMSRYMRKLRTRDHDSPPASPLGARRGLL